MFTVRETAGLLTALQYWQDEMLPHGRSFMRPYFRAIGCDRLTPLNRAELDRLSSRLKGRLRSLGA